MLGRILKYPLTVEGEQTIHVPPDSRVLTLQRQNGIPTLWLLAVTPANPLHRPPPQEWLIRCVGTGWEVWGIDEWTHLGTVGDAAGYIWHYFRQEVGA